MSDQPRGLILDIYRSASYPATSPLNSFGQVNEVTIIGITERNRPGVTPMPKGSRVFAPSEKAPAAYLEKFTMMGRVYWSVVPVDKPEGALGPMAGGAYASTSDSRLGEITGIHAALSLHDRFESPELYAALSQ